MEVKVAATEMTKEKLHTHSKQTFIQRPDYQYKFVNILSAYHESLSVV
jgi:hypothetical protein